MCGISFLYDKADSHSAQRRMSGSLAAIQNRGPDEQSSWMDGATTIGHARLSIIDLEHSRQPMASPDGRYVLAYNGEIYNYQMLRAEMSERWDFRTRGDTELLLAGLITEGEAYLRKLEGMWAFVLWDRHDKRLLASRDRLGKKPFFYTAREGFFAACSELPGLRYLDDQAWHEDLKTTADYFNYGYALPGYTIYREVGELKPASYLVWQADTGSLNIDRFWKPEIRRYQGTYGEAKETLRSLTESAVQKRLVSDVEVGCFLSGGIDSSIVAALAVRGVGNRRLKTFTTAFPQKAFDESPFAGRVASYLGVDHHVGTLTDLKVSDLTELLLQRVGQPFLDSSLLPTALVSETAARHVKVVLSGDGADELFCGYERYKARALVDYYLRLPVLLRKAFRKTLSSMGEPDVHHSRSLLKKAFLFLDIVDRRLKERPYIAPVLYSQKMHEGLFPGLPEGHGSQMLIDCPFPDSEKDVREMMLGDTQVYLPQDILVKVDRATMHHGLEARSPFLDRALVEFALSLPLSWTFSFRQNKKILQDAHADLIPKEVGKRRKQGFGVPIAEWFKGTLGDDFTELLGQQGPVPFNTEAVRSLLADHRAGKRDNSHRLWGFWVYILWKNSVKQGSHLVG